MVYRSTPCHRRNVIVALRILVLSAAALPLSCSSSRAADELEMQRLLQRLEQQSARIERLERQLQADSSQLFPTALGLEQPAPVGVSDGDGGEQQPTAEQAVAADDEGLEKAIRRLDDLETELGELGDELSEVSGDKSIVHSGSSRSTMKVSGRIHADYWAFPNTSGDVDAFEGGDPQDRLGFRRVRFGVGGDIKDNMRYRIEMEFAGGNDVEFRDVYLGWDELPVLQTVLLGNQKRPYGLDHLNSSRYNVFLERPFVIEAFNQDSRRLGLVSYGFSDDLRYNWRYGVYNLRLIQDEGNYVGDHYQLELAGRLANTIWYDEVSDGRGYAHWAIAGSYADPDGLSDNNEARFRHRPEARSSNRWIDTGQIAGATDYGLMGLESVINVGPCQFVGEYQHVWLDRRADFGDDLEFYGGYFYVSYFLTGEHMPWDRETGTLDRVYPFENFWLVRGCDGRAEAGWGAWQLAARYSYGNLTDDDIFGGIGENFTFGMNWYWNPNARLQFNVINGKITERTAGLLSGDYTIIGTRFMVDF